MSFHHTTLPNGLTILGEVMPSAYSVALGFFVQTGARDETPDIAGVSHFLEHMAFKGTARRTAWDVNRDFDRIGAIYNAYTSTENTVFFAAIVPEYLPQAIDILADILRPTLRPEDFETEKLVILEEIKMYHDQPDSMAWEHARKLYYNGHPLGHSVLGSEESISALRREQMEAYFRQRYVANNIILAISGNFVWSELVDMATRLCGEWPSGVAGRTCTEWRRDPAMYVLRREGVQQQHVILLTAGPPPDSPLCYAANVLSLAIGDNTGSRLYWALIDPGRADAADFDYHENHGAGSFCSYYTCDPNNAADNLKIVQDLLGEVQRHSITAEELQIAKNKIASRIVRASERPMGRLGSIAGMWIYTGEYRDVDRELALYDAVTLDAIRECLDRYPIDAATIVAYGPLHQFQGIEAQTV